MLYVFARLLLCLLPGPNTAALIYLLFKILKLKFMTSTLHLLLLQNAFCMPKVPKSAHGIFLASQQQNHTSMGFYLSVSFQ